MQKKHRTIKTILSLLLTLSILIGITPFSAVSVPDAAETSDTESYSSEEFKAPDIIDEEEQTEKSYVGRVKEDEKDLYTLVFKNEDGSNTMRVFDHPVKYIDDKGETRDISLEISKDKDGSFKAADHMIKASFGNDISEGIGLEYDDVRIEMVAKSGSIEKAKAGLSDDGKKLTYAVDDKTSYVYSLTYCGIKEDIVVNEYTGQTEYEFTLKTNGLHPVKIGDSVFLADNDEEIKASIGDIIIFTADNRNNAFGDLEFETVEENSKYKFTIVLDPDYLKDEETAYPITIDPTVEINYDNNGAGAIEDVTINSLDTSSGSSGSIYVGLRNPYGISRILMRFPTLNLSGIASSNDITSATVQMKDLLCESESMYVECYIFNGGSWSESNVGWNTVTPYTLTTLLSNVEVKYSIGNSLNPLHRYSFSILDAVKGWKNGTADQSKGIIFKAPYSVENGNTYINKTFASYNRASNQPTLTIVYNNTPTMTLESEHISVYAWETATIRILNYSNNYTTFFLLPYNSSGVSIIDQHDGTCLVTSIGSCTVNISVFLYSLNYGLMSLGTCEIIFELPVLNGYYYIKNAENNCFVDRLYSLSQINVVTHDIPPVTYNIYVEPNSPVNYSVYSIFAPYYDAYVLEYHYDILKKYDISYLNNGYYTIKVSNTSSNSLTGKYLSCNSSYIEYADIKFSSYYNENDDNVQWRITKTATGNLKLEPKVLQGYFLIIGEDDLFGYSQYKRLKIDDCANNSSYADEWVFISASTLDYSYFFKGTESQYSNPGYVTQCVEEYASYDNKTGYTFDKATKGEMLFNGYRSKVYGILTHGLYDRILIDSDVTQNTTISLTTEELWEMESTGFSNLDLVFLGCCFAAFEGEFLYNTHGVTFPGIGNMYGVTAYVNTSFAHEMYNCGAKNVLAFNDAIGVIVTESWTIYFFEEFYRTIDPLTGEHIERTLSETIDASIDYANNSLYSDYAYNPDMLIKVNQLINACQLINQFTLNN